MSAYADARHDVNGIDTAVLTAGEGAPIVVLHGGGTAPGFDELLPLADGAQLILPFHPGFGASADDPDGLPPPAEFLAERAREAASLARVAGQRPYDAKLQKWLHRISAPALILWGEADRLIPVGQAAVWAGLIPGSEVRTCAGAPHLLFNESPDAVTATGAFIAAGA